MTCKLITFTIKMVKIFPALHTRTPQRKNALKIKPLPPEGNADLSATQPETTKCIPEIKEL